MSAFKDGKHIVIGGKPVNKLNVVDKTKEPKSPAFYTEREGGEWLSWTGGKLNPYELDTTKATGKLIIINKIQLHSLLFPTINPYKFIRWDALNGWTGFIDVR